MIALDTNILARYLLGDEPRQSRAARALLEDAGARYWLPVTVVLELAWVLRAAGASRAELAAKLRALLALRNVRAQLPEALTRALAWAEQGADFADALHLALSSKAERLLTFDEALVKRGARLGLEPPVRQPKL